MSRRGAPLVALAAVAAATAGFFAARGGGTAPLASGHRLAVAAAVDSATRAFEAAERALDAAAVIAHLDPDFYMYVDGRRLEYESVVENIERTFSGARRYDPGFTNVEVLVQAPDAAFASFEFRDALTDAAGVVQRYRGATTLAWVKCADTWQIVYAHADHYPDADTAADSALRTTEVDRGNAGQNRGGP